MKYLSLHKRLMLSGGMQFFIDGEVATGNAHKWHARVYKKLIPKITRWQLSVGFAAIAFVPNEQYMAEPICVELDQCTIEFYLSPLGTHRFRIALRDDFYNALPDATFLENVLIIATDEYMPTASGRFRSVIANLAPLKERCETRRIELKNGEKTGGKPVVFLEHQPESLDTGKLPFGTEVFNNDSGGATIPVPGTVGAEGSFIASDAGQLKRYVDAVKKAEQDADRANGHTTQHGFSDVKTDAVEVIPLHTGFKASTVVMPHATPDPESAMDALEDAFGTIIGIPFQTIHAEGRFAANERHKALHEETRLFSKGDMAEILTTVLCFGRNLAREALATRLVEGDTELDEDTILGDVQTLLHLQKKGEDDCVQLPAVPPIEQAVMLHQRGYIKDDRAGPILAGALGISAECFRTTPAIKPRDLLPTQGQTASRKPAAKKKAKPAKK